MREGHVTTGLVIGRFCPPHRGHDHLIRTAATQVDRLAVLVTVRPGEPVPGELRVSWLAELHPDVSVVAVRHDLATNFDDPHLWDRWMALLRAAWPFDTQPDLVFSSEAYGQELARRFGARAVSVDPDRATVPISATRIREDPLAHLDYLAPPVRAWVERWARGEAGPA